MEEARDTLAQVGAFFLSKYYGLLHENPSELHLFYKDDSTLTRITDTNEKSEVSFGAEAIGKSIVSQGYVDCTTTLISADFQASVGDSIIVCATGTLSNEGGCPRPFTETFLLEPHADRLYIRNDLFCFLSLGEKKTEATKPSTEPKGQNHVSAPKKKEDRVEKSVTKVKSEPKVDPEVQPKAEPVPESETQPQSWAKLVARTSTQQSGPTASNSKPEPAVTTPEVKESSAAAPASKQQDRNACSIYVSKLPSSVNEQILRELFEKFGTIANIQLVNSPNSKGKQLGYGFVQFQTPEQVKNAILQCAESPIVHDGQTLSVEEKKPGRSGSRSRGRGQRGGRGGDRGGGVRGARRGRRGRGDDNRGGRVGSGASSGGSRRAYN